jgi:hypothetical protein
MQLNFGFGVLLIKGIPKTTDHSDKSNQTTVHFYTPCIDIWAEFCQQFFFSKAYAIFYFI